MCDSLGVGPGRTVPDAVHAEANRDPQFLQDLADGGNLASQVRDHQASGRHCHGNRSGCRVGDRGD